MVRHDFDFRRALKDPKAEFGTPERVLADPRLDREGKRTILKSWEQDERQMAVAEEEGMAGGERDMLRRVLRALDAVSNKTADTTAPISKHGGGGARAERDPKAKGDATRQRPALLVRDVMRAISEVVHVDEDLHEAYVRMRDFQTPFLPIADGDEIVGILTARDIYDDPRAADDGKRAAGIGDHLSKEIAFCYEDDDVETAMDVMEQSGHRRLLVTDDADQLVGLITLEMITAALRRHGLARLGGAGPGAAERTADTAGRAKGNKPGRPRLYAIKPKLKR